MPFRAYNPPPFKPFEATKIGRATNAAGALQDLTLAYASPYTGLTGAAANDGDKYYYYLMCDGTETILEHRYYQHTMCGVFDIYINGVIDSSTYEGYNAGGATLVGTKIALTAKTVPGLNTVQIRINGKNGAATDYTYWGVEAKLR
jgi:hypothetical protein